MKVGSVRLPVPEIKFSFGGDEGKTPRLRRLAFFKKGNSYAAKENMSPDAHARRMAGLMKTWENQKRQRKGETFVTRRSQTRKRAKLRETIAMELHEVQEMARKNAKRAMERLAEISDTSDNESMAIAASSVILDRAYGKSSQTNINANVNADGKPSEIDGKELAKRIDNAIKRVETIAGGAPKAGKSKERPADIRQPDRDPNSTTH